MDEKIREMEDKIRRLENKVAEVEGEVKEAKLFVDAAVKEGAALDKVWELVTREMQQEKYGGKKSEYAGALRADLVGLRADLAALQADLTALRADLTAQRADLTALRAKENELQAQKTAQEQARTAQEQARTAQEQAKVADLQPRSLWDRMDQPGDEFDDNTPRNKRSGTSRSTSMRLTNTEHWPEPTVVTRWEDFESLIEPPRDIHTTDPFKLSLGADHDRNMGEDGMISGVLSPFLYQVVHRGARPLVKSELCIMFEQRMQQLAFIPDATCYLDRSYLEKEDEVGLFPIEAKDPGKYEPQFGNLVNHWEHGQEKADQSPIKQIWTYSCAMESRFCVLTTGQFTWFMQRQGEGEVLLVSKGFQPSDTGPSLAQAWIAFIALAVGHGAKEKASGLTTRQLQTLQSVKNARREARRGARDLARRVDQAVEEALSRGAAAGGGAEDAAALLLPLEDLECAFSPTESYGALNHGVAHRMEIHGHDAVIKIVDAQKDRVGEEGLEHEEDMYWKVRELWGTAVPSLVFAGPITLGRHALATTYAGRTLEEAAVEDVPEETRAEARAALLALHEHGLLHGDVALRNIAVHPETGAVKLIDLGNACKAAGPGAKADMERELQALDGLFGGAGGGQPKRAKH